MKRTVTVYRVREVPDATDRSLTLLAGGDLYATLQTDGELLLRSLAAFPAGSVSVAIRYVYQPGESGDDPQKRLTMYVAGQAHDHEMAATLKLLLERGPLARFYEFRPVDGEHVSWDGLRARCDIVRRQSLLEPTVAREFNSKVPALYWSICSFEPREDNDCRLLDSVLSPIEEPVRIEVCVEPADVTHILSAHTRYLARLQEINRTWDSDDLDDLAGRLWSEGRPSASRVRLKPLRHRDPLADEIRRDLQSIHETLVHPHLRFHIRVWAPAPPLARLLASVVAESAFADGSYQLIDSQDGEPPSNKAQTGETDIRVVTVPTLERPSCGERSHPYQELASLAHMAPVDQLTSVFRLPVAGYDSPRCFRKSTDPRQESADDLIIFGHEEQRHEP